MRHSAWKQVGERLGLTKSPKSLDPGGIPSPLCP